LTCARKPRRDNYHYGIKNAAGYVEYELVIPPPGCADSGRRRDPGRGLAERWKMIFETLYESSQRGELHLIDGGFCHWHLRKDGTLTIYEIISTRPGAGSEMLEMLKLKGSSSLFAKCPADLEANDWYQRRGFVFEGFETTKTGRLLKLWRLKNE